MHGQIEPIQRAATSEERKLLRFLLDRGYPEAYRFIPQIEEVRIVGECLCGCDSLYFLPSVSENRLVLAQHWTEGTNGGRLGTTVFAIDEQLAGVEFLEFDWKGDVGGAASNPVLG